MRGFLFHTASDVTNLGVVGPVFPDGKFEYLPINNRYGLKTHSYKDMPARSKVGKTLSDFVPSYISDWSVHYDPGFEENSYTYGQPTADYPRSKVLEKLKAGDAVFFVCSLAPYDKEVYADKDAMLKKFQRGKKNKYVFGFFKVQGVARVTVLKSNPKPAALLLGIASYQETGEQPFDLDSERESVKVLEEWGYVAKEGQDYKVTAEDDETPRGGEEIVLKLLEKWSEDEKKQDVLLKSGYLEIEALSGYVTEEDVKASEHYKRMKPLDWDQFILVKGNPEASAILNKTVQLTDGFQQYDFNLNSLGKSILQRAHDTLRGFRWIDAASVKLLADEIGRKNPELLVKLNLLTK